ncbi:hypothetical protein [uncultured Thiocystis sp.]|jgi:hypothetical protein|uniref:hypothetical protein n=1 Tax=uncultured Thiocystis sp. TaxID=1202134 RepID=UPI0025E88766|nr:hypothetical protein [uncultured Thiocystis sp.]
MAAKRAHRPPEAPPLDWFVFTRKTSLMQRLADLVRSGHRWFVAGNIAPERAGLLAGKFDAHYQVTQTRLQASRARAAGAATFRLLLLHQDDTPELRFWLLRTAGDVPPAAAREAWQDALEQRLELTGYELVRLTRPDQATPAWTWRYTREREQALRAALIGAIRGRRDLELQQLIHTIWRTPGFAGARPGEKAAGAHRQRMDPRAGRGRGISGHSCADRLCPAVAGYRAAAFRTGGGAAGASTRAGGSRATGGHAGGPGSGGGPTRGDGRRLGDGPSRSERTADAGSRTGSITRTDRAARSGGRGGDAGGRESAELRGAARAARASATSG